MIFAVIAKEVLGLNVNVVRGYTGAAPMFLAMQRGELDGQMVGLSSIRTGQRDLWNRKAFRPLHGRSAAPRGTRNFPTSRPAANSPMIPSALALHGIRGASVLHGAAVRRAARTPAGPRQGAADGLHGDVPGQEPSSTTPRSSASTSARSTATAILTMLARTAATPKDVIARYNAISGEKK